MKTLLSQIQNNLTFFLVCVAIVAGLTLLAKLSERLLPKRRVIGTAHRVSIVGICAAIATVLHILDFPLVFLAPEFYKLDFSEIPVLMCGFYLGPTATVVCEGVKILLKLLLKGTSTAFVGDFANFVVGCSFVVPAVFIYHLKKNKKAAVIGLIVGTACMAVFGSLFNAVYLLPKFAQLYKMPMEAILALGSKVNAGVTDIFSFVAICVAPLNVVKGTVVSLLTLLLYKNVARPIFAKL